MEITKELYERMERCCRHVILMAKEEKLIEKELEKLGVDIESMRWHDSPVIDFINYGHPSKKEIIEEDLDKYVKTVQSEGEKDERA